MALKKYLMLLSATLLLSACASTEPVVVHDTKIISTNIQIQPRPRAVQLNDIEFKVVNQDNLDEFLQSIDLGGEYVFIAFTVRDYEKLALNVDELRRYISQQKELIVYYERSVANSNSVN